MKQRHIGEQFIGKLREAGLELGQGRKTLEVCHTLGVTEQTYFRWSKDSQNNIDGGNQNLRFNC